MKYCCIHTCTFVPLFANTNERHSEQKQQTSQWRYKYYLFCSTASYLILILSIDHYYYNILCWKIWNINWKLLAICRHCRRSSRHCSQVFMCFFFVPKFIFQFASIHLFVLLLVCFLNYYVYSQTVRWDRRRNKSYTFFLKRTFHPNLRWLRSI